MQLRQKLHAADDPREGRELLAEGEGPIEEAGDPTVVRKVDEDLGLPRVLLARLRERKRPFGVRLPSRLVGQRLARLAQPLGVELSRGRDAELRD